jgi:AcrR family transcriptional regulator
MTAETDVARMADHVLSNGLTGATLRPLAQAAGTSDRMLIYRFGSKEGVIAALLDHLAHRFTALLEAADLGQPASNTDLIKALITLLRRPEAEPFLRVWLDVVSGAGRNTPAFRATAARILIHFKDWIAAHLPDPGPDPQATAAICLAVIEGCLVLAAAGDPGARLVDAALDALGQTSL